MNQKKVYLAVDLGAASGRVLAGIFDAPVPACRQVNRHIIEAIDFM